MSTIKQTPFKYQIGDPVWQLDRYGDSYELAEITDRKIINTHPCYITTERGKWEHESRLSDARNLKKTTI